MILYFKVSNSRSFANEATLSMIATADYPSEYSYIIEPYNIKVLKTSLIYGANASGKSNILKALADAVSIILESHMYSKKIGEGEILSEKITWKYFPNKNELTKKNEPSTYIIGFLIGERIYEYSFSNDKERILYESLTEKHINGDETIHFIRFYNRKNDKYFFPELSKVYAEKFETLIPFTKKENLFLSISAQLSEEDEYRISISDMIYDFFMNKVQFSINLSAPGKGQTEFALELIRRNPKLKSVFLDLLKNADFSIIDIKFRAIVDENGQSKFLVKTVHKGLNKQGNTVNVEYDLFKEESVGTQQFISWLGYWILASTENKTLFIDEFGNSMHPMLTEFLLGLFQRNKGQLIFSTHDVKLMNSKFIKPEQIWIIKKNELANSSIYSLSDFNIDEDKMIDNIYLDGLFKGVPNLIY